MNRMRRYASKDNIIMLGFVGGQNAYIPLESVNENEINAYLSN